MNQHLQKILDLIEQHEKLTAEEKAVLIKAAKDTDSELTVSEFKLERTEKVKRTTAILLEETIEELEQKRKAVEAQNRELEIESSLERVRTVAMGMHKQADLMDICKAVYTELQALGFSELRNTLIDTFSDAEKYFTDYDYSEFSGGSSSRIPYSGNPVVEKYIEDIRKSGDAFFEITVEGTELETWKKFRRDNGEMEDPRLDGLEALYYYKYSIGPGSIGISTYSRISTEKLNILHRFRNVFNLSYQRYADITKAEAQAREAQIQLCLERVRAKSMAMQHSDELHDFITVLFEQFDILGIKPVTGFLSLIDGENNSFVYYQTGKHGKRNTAKQVLSLNSIGAWKEVQERWKAGNPEQVLSFHYPKKMIPQVFELFKESRNGISKDTRAEIKDYPDGIYTTEGYCRFGYIGFTHTRPSTEEEKDIVRRFAAEFGISYIRFQDLQKAEAQVRESQIQLALERVRARTMAMQKSEDMNQTASEMFKQIQSLGMQPWGCGFNIFDKDEKAVTQYMSLADGGISPPFRTPLIEDPFFLNIYEGRKRGDELLVWESKGESLAETYRYMFSLPGSGEIFGDLENSGFEMPKSQITHCAYFSQGYLVFITYEPVPGAHDIFKRFAKVFEQTYTRFLDLQKAEAQAREGQVEAGLERVRSRTMAMQRSDELAGTAALLFQEFKKLVQQELIQTTIGIYNEEKNEIEFRATDWVGSGEQVNKPAYGSMDEPSLLKPAVTAWKAQEKSLVVELTGEALEQWTNYRNKMTGTAIATKFDGGRRVISIAFFSKGHLSMSSPLPLPAETVKILERFAAVFDGTYTRFLDLQKAEAQAREAQIEAALERVRSRTLAMQRSDELADTAAVVFQQLITLGIEPNRLYIAVIKNEEGDSEFWITDEDGSKVSTAFTANMHNNVTLLKMFEGWKEQQRSLIIDLQGEELQNYFHYLTGLGVPFKGGLVQKRRIQEIAYFSKGFIGMASPDEQPAETLQLLERFAAVFNLTFTRFNDLQVAEAHALQAEQDLIAIKEAKQKAEVALTELQSTQKQLIQSEKMASLGELTAGIAHEIQNPLNFVNNFSEVSKELLDEMKQELEKGNVDDAKEIMSDVIQNLEKINHHGKRADGIVKGMLQHSRAGSGQKEPTDINALCEEYLRLAYHGLRAKDKTFNAKFETHFDDSIGKINVLPQDLGRVVLNLINNAFYAVTERKKQEEASYEPRVTVSTEKAANYVIITVKDNGTGIPQRVIDKIFQPFFTTKPTGQGTGLGLSLSFDIVTKGHGGELKVETTEGERTEFIIRIPAFV